ncbi:MAG: TonB-dependent receptor [Pseudomonadota bacterium]
MAQQTPASANRADVGDGELEAVVVTGSRVSGRTVENSAVPVDVISSRDLQSTGQVNLVQALESLLPSFQRNNNSQSDVEKTHPGVKLRGLNPGYTLVLVNGKRRNTSAYVSPQTFPGQTYADISLIPTAAVERVEVLRDGASAIYGSDAVAGVFNIILKSNYQGGAVGVEWGKSYEGDGERQDYYANAGFSLNSKGFLSLSAERSSQKAEYRTVDYLSNDLFYPLLDASGNAVSAATYGTVPQLKAVSGDPYHTTTGTSPLTNNTGNLLVDPQQINHDGSINLGSSVSGSWVPNGQLAYINPKDRNRDLSWVNVDSSSTGVSRLPVALSANLDYSLTDNLDVYAFGTYTKKFASSRWGYRQPLKLWANNPGFLEDAVYPDGFIPRIDTDEIDYSAVAGLRSKVSGWDTDFSLTYNHDSIDILSDNTLNLGQQYTSAAAGSVAVKNFFAGSLIYGQLLGNLDLRRGFAVGWLDSPLQSSFGFEFQHEQYQRTAGDPLGYYRGYYGPEGPLAAGKAKAPQAQDYPSNRPEDAVDQGRHGEAVYAGLAANATRSWYVDVAARYEDHSDYGDVFAGRLSTRWDITDFIGLRATASNGFHAPGLGAQGFQVDKVTPTSHTIIAEVGSPVAVALGATPLTPEKSRNYSVGVAFNLDHDLKAAIDFYRIYIDGQLGISSAVGYDYSDGVNAKVGGVTLTAAQKAAYDAILTGDDAIVPGDNLSYQYFTNIGDFRYHGFEATLEDAWELAGGRLRASYAFSQTRVAVENVRNLPANVLALYGQTQKTLDSYASYNTSLPKYNQILNLSYTHGSWNLAINEVNTAARKQAGVSISGVTSYYKVDPTFVTNLSAGYRFQNGLGLEIGAQNALNEKTQKLPASQVSATTQQYTSYVSGTNLTLEGGRYYARANYRF